MTIDNVLGSISVFVTKSSDQNVVTKGLDLIINPALNFHYHKRIEQSLLPYSVRIFSVRSIPDSLPFGDHFPPARVAKELFQYSQGQARYDPPENPDKQKGWEIRQTLISGERVAVALAVWI